jgi:hypothetical protein
MGNKSGRWRVSRNNNPFCMSGRAMVDNRTRDTPITGMTDNFNSNSRIADQQHTWVPETETFKRAFPTRKGGCCTRKRERELGTVWRRCSWTSDWPVVDYRRLVTWAPPAIGMEPSIGGVDGDYTRYNRETYWTTRPPPTPQLIHKVVVFFFFFFIH